MFCIAWRVLLLLGQDHGMVTDPALAASSHRVCISLTLSLFSSPLPAASCSLPAQFPAGKRLQGREQVTKPVWHHRWLFWREKPEVPVAQPTPGAWGAHTKRTG